MVFSGAAKGEQANVLDDVAVVYGFWGTDADRIEAAVRAVKYMLESSPAPKDVVFVEAQASKSDAAFGWLKRYGVKYAFRKYGRDSEGLFLKTALWNIGASMTGARKLCFVDADVAFCDAGWLASADEAFGKYDVLSLAGHVYYEGDASRTAVVDSIGYNAMVSGETKFGGHPGFTLGMTRAAYETYGGFEAFNMHDDIWIWQRVLGSENYPDQPGWNPYASVESMKYGLPFRVGSTEECCCHLRHGPNFGRYKLYGFVSSLGTSRPFEDISYDRNDAGKLPEWAVGKAAQAVRLAFRKIRESGAQALDDSREEAERILLEAKKEVYGEIDADHPLVVFTAFAPDFRHKGIESVFEHKEMLERRCRQPFTYVCFTDEISVEDARERGLDVIPFSSEKVRNDRSLWRAEMRRKDVRTPKNATSVWIDVCRKFEKEFEITRD